MSDVWQDYESGFNIHFLKFSIDQNDLEEVRYMILEKRVDINSKGGGSEAPIHMAAKYGHQKILKLLIESGADVNIRDEMDRTPIFMAKDARIAEILVEAGAEVNVNDRFNYEPLHCAVMEKDKLSVIKYLVLHCGVDVNARVSPEGESPLQLACDYCRLCLTNDHAEKLSLDVVKFLVKNNANVNNVDLVGNTALKNLLNYRKSLDPEVIKIFSLILRYSDISLNYFGGWSNILYICNQKFLQILLERVAVLLSLGATLSSHEDLISNENYIRVKGYVDLGDHFEGCNNELVQAKKTKIGESWLTVHHLLTDSKRKLKNYAGNDDLVESFRGTDWTKEFPIYGKEMMEKMDKGVKIRKFYDESCCLLSSHLPIFGPNHLIVRDVLDRLTCSTKDLVKFTDGLEL